MTMRVCVFHVRFAERIAQALREALPELDVVAVSNTSRDPPEPERIDVLVANTFPSGLLERLPKLRWLQLTGAGFDHLPSVLPAGLRVSHAGSTPAFAVAEFAMMGVLGLAKQAPTLVNQQARGEWKPQPLRRVRGATLVLLGVGNIGGEIARRARAFGMRVIGLSRSAQPAPWLDESWSVSRLREAAALADFLVLCAPATEQTRRLVDRSVLEAMKPDAFLINVARASLLDGEALRELLAQKRLGGAMLDVHEREPLPPDSPAWSTERLWVTPHCAFEYPEQVEDLCALVVENTRRYLAAQPLGNELRD